MSNENSLPRDASSPPLTDATLERLARRRAGAKLGWFIHAAVFVAINALLMTIAAMSGKSWAVFPLLSWGLGLAIHGAVVWFGGAGSALHERLLQKERQALSSQRDPW